MTQQPDILHVITARGGSQGVPGKNLKTIGGISLVGFKAIAARRSKTCQRLVITTDSEDIQAEARHHGVEVPFTRPAELASDTALSEDALLHLLDYVETVEKSRYDAIMLLEPSSPFATPDDLDAAVAIFTKHDASLVVGMKRTEVTSWFVGHLREDGRADQIISKFAGRDLLRRQAFEPEYTMNGALYLIDWDMLKRTGKVYGDPERTYGYPMDRFSSVEIDTPYDLRLAELFVENGDVDLEPWR